MNYLSLRRYRPHAHVCVSESQGAGLCVSAWLTGCLFSRVYQQSVQLPDIATV